jgi:tetratricopeptide (TPR) repeat protein
LPPPHTECSRASRARRRTRCAWSSLISTTAPAISAFDDTLKQALTIDLEQSPAVRIVSDAEVTRTLRLMQRRADERMTATVARDVCRRIAGHAVLSGSLAILNSEYVLGLNAIDCESGEAVAREQTRTSRKEDVLAAVDAAAVDLRRKLGESTASIQHFDKHVHDMLTTPSLDAFQAYTSGERNVLTKGGWSAIGFFQRAIDLDPDFAYAHAAIGLVLGNMGDATRSRMHTERAYELRDRVSEWERFLITAQYYKRVTGEIEKIPPLCDLWIQAYPRDRTAHRLMASAYSELGQYSRALEEIEQARRVGEDHPLDVDAWVTTAMQLDRVPEATTVARQAIDQAPDRLPFRQSFYRLSFLAGDVKEMAAQVAWAMRTPGADALFVDQSNTDAYFGQVAKAASGCSAQWWRRDTMMSRVRRVCGRASTLCARRCSARSRTRVARHARRLISKTAGRLTRSPRWRSRVSATSRRRASWPTN